MRAQRRSLEPDEHQRRSAAIRRRLLSATVFMRAGRFAAFLSNDGEPELGPLFHRAAQLGKLAYLPSLHGNSLWFLPFTLEAPMVTNRFGIAEPACHPDKRVKPYALDLVLVPLVAFDDLGSRLGMGGGYYDRAFAYLNARKRWRRPKLIGVAFEFQRADKIPTRPWDVRLDGIVTDLGFYPAGRPS